MNAADTNNAPKPRNRGIYLLPNFFTTAGLFAGFYAVVAAMKGLYDTAAIAIFIAMITDTLDGRVARLTRTQTAFGAEYDSLSDIVAFGIAPALVMYSWTLSRLGKVGWLVAFLYVAGGALRLARFNTQIGKIDKRYFHGLPIPAAAGVLAGLVWVGSDNAVVILPVPLIALLVLVIAILMVSNMKYYSFKDFNLKNRVPFFVLLVIVLIFVGIAADPPQMLLLIFSVYALSGPVLSLVRFYNSRRHHTSHVNDHPTT